MKIDILTKRSHLELDIDVESAFRRAQCHAGATLVRRVGVKESEAE